MDMFIRENSHTGFGEGLGDAEKCKRDERLPKIIFTVLQSEGPWSQRSQRLFRP